jgi:TonB family protein
MRGVDVLDRTTDLKRPLVGSLVLHGSLALVIAAFSYVKSTTDKWGTPDSQGGSVGITVTDSVPLPKAFGQRSPRLANDTESEAPSEKDRAREERERREAELAKLIEKDLRRPVGKRRSNTKDVEQRPDNQATNPDGSRVQSPNYGGTPGSAGVGVGASTFGKRFGAYLDLVQQRIGQKWRPDQQGSVPGITLLAFTIRRDGTLKDVKLLQTSGNTNFDLSAQRAIQEASPFPELPSGYERDLATVEVAFRLQR